MDKMLTPEYVLAGLFDSDEWPDLIADPDKASEDRLRLAAGFRFCDR
jgi:hypothetical protein